MYYVYFLTHRRCIEHQEDGDVYNTKVLGIYTAKRKAEEGILFFSQKTGFCDYKNDFYIQKKKLLGDIQKSVRSVFLIEYEHFLYDDIYHKEFLGIYSNENSANDAVELLKQKHGYDEHMEEYEIIEYDLDAHSTYWSEGFDLN